MDKTVMNLKGARLQNRLYMVAAVILLGGIAGSILIYLTAPDDSDEMMIYEFEHSKMYRHDLELYGGKMNVLASEFMHWFSGLWHGKELAYTVAFITGIITVVIFLVAYHLQSDKDDHDLTHQ